MAAIARSVVLACTLALASGAADSSLSLVQTRAARLKKPTEEVGPRPHDNVSDAFAAVSAQVGEFQSSVAAVERQHRVAVTDSKSAYTKKLTAQLLANQQVKEANSKLDSEIKHLTSKNADLRTRAAELQKNEHALLKDQRALESNLTTALQFANESIRSAVADTESPDLDVLEELEKESSSHQSLADKQAEQDEIASLGKQAKLLLLEESALRSVEPKESKDDPTNLLVTLEGQLASLQQEHAASEAALEESFAQKLQALEDIHAELVKEQDKLQATKDSLEELQVRLDVAVQFLQKRRDASLEHSRSLRKFARSIGSSDEANNPKTHELNEKAATGKKNKEANKPKKHQLNEKSATGKTNKDKHKHGGKHTGATSLLELHADRGAGHAPHLPSTKQMLDKPTAVFQEMTAQVSELEQRFAAVQQNNKDTMAKQKASFEHTLGAQRHEMKATASANTELEEDVAALKSGNARLRRQAAGLQNDCSNLRAEMHKFQAKLITSHEFATEALERHNTSGAPELAVLDELEEEDKASHVKKAHTQRFDEITQLSLVEVAGVETPGLQHPQELLGVLAGSFEELMKEEEVSEAALKSKFEHENATNAKQEEALLAEQGELNSTKVSLEKLQVRLQAAVGHLDHTKAFLVKRMSSLRSFVGRLTGESDGKAASLLQLANSVARGNGTEVEDFVGLSDPSRPTVVHTLNSQINALEERVQTVQRESDAALSKRKASYEQKLKTQQSEIHDAVAQNLLLSEEIAELEHTNTDLEKRADKIIETTHRLQEDTLTLQANVTMVQEFSERLLGNLSDSKAPELEVLREIATESEKRQSHKAHEQRLGEIAAHSQSHASVSMLELTTSKRAQVPAGTDPNLLVTMLEDNLDALAEEHSDREASLKREFTEKFRAGTEQHERLLAEQQALLSSRTSLKALRSRLELAVAHLGETQARLEEGLLSLKSFMRHVGDEAVRKGVETAKMDTTGGPEQQRLTGHPQSEKAKPTWMTRLAAWADPATRNQDA